MRRRCAVTALALAVAVPPVATAGAVGRVEVSYIEPQNFVDAGFGRVDRERTLKSLTEFLQTLGERLPAGQTLQIAVTGIDLAGELRPTRMSEVRILRGGADWPRITLRYALVAEGRTMKSGEDAVSDLNYLSNRIGTGDAGALAYEKRMLRKWFDEHFAEH